VAYRDKKQSNVWLGITVVIWLSIFLVTWFVKPFGNSKDHPAAIPVAQSTDWVLVPKGPAVPVKLPQL